MNSDSYYQIGTSHTYCQDYALAGEFVLGGITSQVAIVSDGCSGANDTDIGARMMAHSALAMLGAVSDPYTIPVPDLAFGVAKHAARNIQSFHLDASCLLATLVIAITDGQRYRVIAIGDGAIVFIDKNDQATIKHISYPENCPHYAVYQLPGFEDAKQQIQQPQFSESVIRTHRGIVSARMMGQFEETGIMKGDLPPYSADGDVTNLRLIAVMSDGIDTGYYPGIDDPHGFDTMTIADAVNYKMTQGEFVHRRMRRIKKEKAFSDDISIAAINLEE